MTGSSTSEGLTTEGISSASKRIIVCCDGTWQDGIAQWHRRHYTNILKISRLLTRQDQRLNPPIHQVVFYQAGIGCEPNLYSRYIEGATGSSLREKVQEAYGFIAHNYEPGDEIFLFGFSRGAYTARMVAGFIGQIGLLDKKDMDHFEQIFVHYQKQKNTSNKRERYENNEVLQRWHEPIKKGRTRADPHGDGFTVKCLGVFDTVGSLGLPKELTFRRKFKKIFSFPDKVLGPHIQHAFHAMALNETRADFNVVKFRQTDEGRAKGQTLKQVWFAGSHADIGGGWQCHDLSDLTLVWMVSNIEGMLAMDRNYLEHILWPVAPWGKQMPHDSEIGVFKLANQFPRKIPTRTDDETHEYIHPSVFKQELILPELIQNTEANPSLICELNELENTLREAWGYVPGQHMSTGVDGKKDEASQRSMKRKLTHMIHKSQIVAYIKLEVLPYLETWLALFQFFWYVIKNRLSIFILW
ncbi:hypothetical protein M422DRAFT_35987 [Sphaerobolus stellatus SS14]|uniref:T6SS Phospholipase effector Tle1-like catalytic domain-containing protein n=1 Tax=Sphaerobolus stellatus (strain SS14) TaxID=990650 RepID=A0A0C9V3F1_SPHS4|nr:hypothetical protein M422DRAFT_35987 [Sphaerobolus stellatus SS14]